MLLLLASRLIVALGSIIFMSGFSAGFNLQAGHTALICAAKHGHMNCVRLLIDAGANLEVEDKVACRRMLVVVLAFALLWFSIDVLI
jgi:hypothetical protein